MGPLKTPLCLHIQLVYLPGEELLLCPQPSGGVDSMAHRAPIELSHEHLRGKEREMLYQNRTRRVNCRKQ